MAVAYRSSNSSTGSSGSITITKPTGLTLGDLMVAILSDDFRTSGFNTPSGWTLIVDQSGPFDLSVTAFGKIADSGDVAASDFTFTHANSGAIIGGHLYAFSGNFTGVGNVYVSSAQTATEPSADVFNFATGITPSLAGSVLLMGAAIGSAGNNIDDSNISTYEVETSNPSWTEGHDTLYGSGGNGQRLGSAYATRTETTSTGYFQITVSIAGGEDAQNSGGVLLAISEFDDVKVNWFMALAMPFLQFSTAFIGGIYSLFYAIPRGIMSTRYG